MARATKSLQVNKKTLTLLIVLSLIVMVTAVLSYVLPSDNKIKQTIDLQYKNIVLVVSTAIVVLLLLALGLGYLALLFGLLGGGLFAYNMYQATKPKEYPPRI